MFLTENMDARIADLGLATLVKDAFESAKQTHRGGTAGYEAPEVESGVFSSRADIYSISVMFFEMAVGEKPKKTVKSWTDTFLPLESESDPKTLALLRFMLHPDPSDRPSAAESVERIAFLLRAADAGAGPDADGGKVASSGGGLHAA